MRKLAFLILIISLIFPGAVIAQGEYQAVLLRPNLDSFPHINTYLDVHAPDGTFVHGLDTSSVSIIEDGKTKPSDSLQELRLGVQVSVVMNVSQAFAIRNNLGISRFDTIRKFLEVWGLSQKEIAIDQLSLFTNSFVNQSQMTSSQAWLTALTTYQPDLKQSAPSLEPFSKALQLALETQNTPPIEKAILYFSPLPGHEMTIAVRDDLIDRAKKAGVRCYIWMVAAKNQFNEPGADSLRRIAEETGGQFNLFSGAETLPEAQSLIEPLRFLYQLSYTSGVVQSGKHQVAARVSFQETTTTSLPTSFDINLLPPNPIFVSVPSSITRTLPKGKSPNGLIPQPANFTVEYLLEFGDGFERDLKSASLLVDEKVVSTINSPPFNKFVWDLSPYTKSGIHQLQVSILDEFGIENQSTVLPVEVITNIQKSTWITALIGSPWVYPLLAVVFAAGVLVSVFYMNWRTRKKPKQSKKWKNDPVNQAVIIPEEITISSSIPQKMKKISAPVQESKAQLSEVNENLEQTGDASIILEGNPQTWGSEQNLVDHWINDPALESVHTRIWRDPNGVFLIADQQTHLGTWVNFSPIPPDGVTLMHGDIIQIGDKRYRFTENPPRSTWQAEVQPYNYS